jgi:hypothetical protein
MQLFSIIRECSSFRQVGITPHYVHINVCALQSGSRDGLTRDVGGLPKNVTGTDGINNSRQKAHIHSDSNKSSILWELSPKGKREYYMVV